MTLLNASIAYLAGVSLTLPFLVAISALAPSLRAFADTRPLSSEFKAGVVNVFNSACDCLEFAITLKNPKINRYLQQIHEVLDPETMRCDYRTQGLEPLQRDCLYGPGVIQLVPIASSENNPPNNSIDDIFNTLIGTMSAEEANAACKEIVAFLNAVTKNGSVSHRLFYWFATYTGNVLGLGKCLLDQNLYADLPTVHSPCLLDQQPGVDSADLGEWLQKKLQLALFKKEIFDAIDDSTLTECADSITKDSFYECKYKFSNQEEVFSALKNLVGTKAGLVFLFYLSQSIRLRLIAENNLVGSLNEVKKAYANEIGSKDNRERWLVDGASNLDVVFTQEATDLSKNVTNLFHSTQAQQAKDGTFVLLKKGS